MVKHMNLTTNYDESKYLHNQVSSYSEQSTALALMDTTDTREENSELIPLEEEEGMD